MDVTIKSIKREILPLDSAYHCRCRAKTRLGIHQCQSLESTCVHFLPNQHYTMAEDTETDRHAHLSDTEQSLYSMVTANSTKEFD